MLVNQKPVHFMCLAKDWKTIFDAISSFNQAKTVSAIYQFFVSSAKSSVSPNLKNYLSKYIQLDAVPECHLSWSWFHRAQYTCVLYRSYNFSSSSFIINGGILTMTNYQPNHYGDGGNVLVIDMVLIIFRRQCCLMSTWISMNSLSVQLLLPLQDRGDNSRVPWQGSTTPIFSISQELSKMLPLHWSGVQRYEQGRKSKVQQVKKQI